MKPAPVSLLDDLATKYQLFSGTLRYRFDIDIQDTKLEMILPEVYEVVQVKVNGMDVGTKLRLPITLIFQKHFKQEKII